MTTNTFRIAELQERIEGLKHLHQNLIDTYDINPLPDMIAIVSGDIMLLQCDLDELLRSELE